MLLRQTGRCVRGAVTLAALLAWSSAASAAPVCPDEPPAGRGTLGFIPAQAAAKEYFFNVRGVLLKVPLGYVTFLPEGNALEASAGLPAPADLKPAEQLGFSFWMPSLRSPKLNLLSRPSYRPCEDGKPPGPGEFIVGAGINWPWLPGHEEAGHITPDAKYPSGIKYLGLSPVGVEYGLTRLEQPPGGYTMNYYHTPLGSDPQFTANCTPDGRAPYPNCVADIWWPQEKLGMYAIFSTEDLPEWRGIIAGARDLADRWRNAVPGSDTR